jgi:hypothetical protein
MNALLTLAAVVALTIPASSQPVGEPFGHLRWGLHFAEVTAIDGRDALVRYPATIYGLPCVVDYRFNQYGRLVAIDLDYTRPHTTATVAIASATTRDGERIGDSLGARFGDRGTSMSYYRPDRDCNGSGDEQVMSGCFVDWLAFADDATIADDVIDGVSGRIEHHVTLRARTLPSSIFNDAPAASALPPVMSLE